MQTTSEGTELVAVRRTGSDFVVELDSGSGVWELPITRGLAKLYVRTARQLDEVKAARFVQSSHGGPTLAHWTVYFK